MSTVEQRHALPGKMSTPPNGPAKRNDGFLFAAARYTSIAMALPAATFAGYIVGFGLDKWFGTSYLKIVFLLLGIASGFYELIRQLTRDMEKSK